MAATVASCVSNVRVPKGKNPFASQYDVKDFFFRLRVPVGLTMYFGLPPISLAERRRFSERMILRVLKVQSLSALCSHSTTHELQLELFLGAGVP